MAIALAGMLIIPDILFKSFDIGTMVIVVTAVAASLTLLPAILGLMGDRVNWLTIPIIGRRSGKDSSGGFWNATTRLVTARPGISMLPHYTDERHAFYTFITEFSDGIITADIVVLAPDVSVAPVQNPMTDLVAATDHLPQPMTDLAVATDHLPQQTVALPLPRTAVRQLQQTRPQQVPWRLKKRR